MVHAVHPNYASKHKKGWVKLPPLQEFKVRNGSGCGSTIGLVLSVNNGIWAIEIRCLQLLVYSIH